MPSRLAQLAVATRILAVVETVAAAPLERQPGQVCREGLVPSGMAITAAAAVVVVVQASS
jgi:hypothetical protein